MFGNKAKAPPPSESCPYEAALRAAVTECATTRRCTQQDRALILALAARLPERHRERLLAPVADMLASPPSRAGEELDRVVRFLDHQRRSEWTLSDLRRGLARQGVPITPKRLSEIAHYLKKAGRFRYLSRGHYLDAHVNLFVTSDLFAQDDIAKGGENEG